MTAIKRKYASEEIYPLSMEWIINKDNLNVASPFMQIPNLPEITYSLSLNPNAGKKEDQAILCFHLKSDKNADIIVNAVISCKSAVFEHEWIYTFKKGETNTYNARICFSDELLDSDSEFFINNQMIIELKGTLKVEIVTEVESKITKYESLGLILWKSEGDKDVVIVVGDNELKAHKLVLKRRSAKFAKLLEEIEIDKKGNLHSSAVPHNAGVDKIQIHHCPFETVKEGIMFCYDIQLSETLSADSASKLLIFSNNYEIKDLKKNMEEFCIENLSVSNAVGFANASISANSESLKQKCFDFLLKCMKDGTAVKNIQKINLEMKETLFFKSFYAKCEA